MTGKIGVGGKVIKEEAVPRIAASSYLNTAPLIWSFQSGTKGARANLLTHKAPARCAQLLAGGEVEAALVPVIEYQRIPEIAVVRGVCVGSRSQVRSVVLVTKGRELKEVERVALDTSSRTSVALLRVLFREFVGHEPEWRASEPDLQMMLADADAALIIGDPAMTFAREGLRVYDLASVWRERTGLGFVFAMWMARAEAMERVRRVDFAGARDEGLRHAEEIAAGYEAQLGLGREELVRYLRENICFELDEEMLAGLELFYSLAERHGLIPARKSLRWIEG